MPRPKLPKIPRIPRPNAQLVLGPGEERTNFDLSGVVSNGWVRCKATMAGGAAAVMVDGIPADHESFGFMQVETRPTIVNDGAGVAKIVFTTLPWQ